MNFISFGTSLISELASHLFYAPFGGLKNRSIGGVRKFGMIHEMKSMTDDISATAIDQSSLQLEKSYGCMSTEFDHDELSISKHGISHMVKGIDLHFLNKNLKLLTDLKKRLIPKGFEGKFYTEEKAIILPKKSYIQPKILHFYNI